MVHRLTSLVIIDILLHYIGLWAKLYSDLGIIIEQYMMSLNLIHVLTDSKKEE